MHKICIIAFKWTVPFWIVTETLSRYKLQQPVKINLVVIWPMWIQRLLLTDGFDWNINWADMAKINYSHVTIIDISEVKLQTHAFLPFRVKYWLGHVSQLIMVKMKKNLMRNQFFARIEILGLGSMCVSSV